MDKNNETLLESFTVICKDLYRSIKFIICFTFIFALSLDMIKTITYNPQFQCVATFAIKSNDAYASSTETDELPEIAEAFNYIIGSNIFRNQMVEHVDLDVHDGYFIVNYISNTNLIKISAISSSPKTSFLMMDYMVKHYSDISTLVLGNVNIEIVLNRVIPTTPYNNLNHFVNIVKFGLIGLVIAISLVVLNTYFKDTIKAKSDIKDKLQMNLYGEIPYEFKHYFNKKICTKKNILITQLTTSFTFIENFKKLRSKLEEHVKYHHDKVFMVTSSLQNEGKSSILANLAIALAQNEYKVLVIDGDLRNPSLKKMFDIQYECGMKEIFMEDMAVKDAIYHDEYTGLDMILGNHYFYDAPEMMETDVMKKIIEYGKKHYDYVLIDSAPAYHLTDSISLAKNTDGVLLVVKQHYAPVKVINDTIDRLTDANVKILGIVMNQKIKTIFSLNHSYGYGYKYGSYYGKSKKERR